MPDLAISVDRLGKRYRILHQREPYGRLTESLWNAVVSPMNRIRGRTGPEAEWLWALKDASFDIRPGEVVGVIGRNGAGKTTLLKLLSRITEPTTGSAVLNGRVGSLLEVGSGFHPELTGRENVYLSGAVLGMRRAEIKRKFDEIVDFSGVERLLDTPVKRYSSGMMVRLGFAVAAHLETEILLVDEVLAVGDAAFQKKSLAKMEDVSHQGRTIIFVSHSMPAVESLCTAGILLDRGSIVATGPAKDVVDRYLRTASEIRSMVIADRRDRKGDGRLRVTEVTSSLRTGSPSELRLRYEAEPGLHRLAASVGLFTVRGEGALYLSTDMVGQAFDEVPANGVLVCRFDKAGLLPGRYSLNVYCTVSGVLADWVIDAVTIDVGDGDFYGTGKLPSPGYGSVAVEHRWSIEPRPA